MYVFLFSDTYFHLYRRISSVRVWLRNYVTDSELQRKSYMSSNSKEASEYGYIRQVVAEYRFNLA